MVCDLYYFYESDLDKTNIKEFYDSLPSHLQGKFKASLHGIQIGEGNVLQGYRGPSNMCNRGSGDSQELKPSHGLQEIKFWWGARKDFNYIPGVGTIIYTGCRTSQYFSGNLDWSSLYFDSHTGECLSHDERKATEKLKNRAKKAKSKPQASSSNYDCDDDSEHREESHAKMMAARDEAHAQDLNFQGDQLFDRGSYIRARKKYEEAFDISEERGPRRTYKRNLQKAQDEIDAKERFYEGNGLFMRGWYREAEAEYQAAYNISDVNNERRIYRESAQNAHIEKFAMLFNSEGNNLFRQGRFEDAISSYERAIDISRVDERIQIYRANIANAHDEIYAVNLNSQGNDLFNEGRYWEALSEYQLACQKSQVAAQIQIYRSNIAKARVEVDALELNSQGYNFLSQNRYDDAISMYLEAHAKSKVRAQCQKYEANADRAKAEADADILNYRGNNLFKKGSYTAALSKYQLACKTSQRAARIQIYRANLAKAQVEIDALKLNSEGDNSFNEGRFEDALSKYQLACNTSKVSSQIQKYRPNIAKARIEMNALQLNAQGDNFFNVGRYNDAVRMYLDAYNKSQITTQKNVYLSNKNKAQDIINKLNMLDTLWKQAWDAENDTKNDRSGEAKDLFQKILNESEENLKTFPGNSKFEQFKALAVLKIEGNEVFNEGVQSQKSGIALFQEAQKLNQQKKCELANEKFKEAKKYFQEALEKFDRGSECDQRFAPCVGFVQDLINAVIDSIKITEQCMFSERLNKLDITSDNHSGAHSCEADVTGKHNNYSQHI